MDTFFREGTPSKSTDASVHACNVFGYETVTFSTFSFIRSHITAHTACDVRGVAGEGSTLYSNSSRDGSINRNNKQYYSIYSILFVNLRYVILPSRPLRHIVTDTGIGYFCNAISIFQYFNTRYSSSTIRERNTFIQNIYISILCDARDCSSICICNKSSSWKRR